MSVVGDLDAVVRLVTSDARAEGSSQKIIIVDRDGRAVDRKPIFSTARYYLVDPKATAEFWREGLGLTDRRTNARIPLKAFCRLSCAPGSEAALAESVARLGARAPIAAIDDELQAGIAAQSVGQLEPFLAEFFTNASLINRALEERLERQFHLRGSVEIALGDRRKLESLEFGPTYLPVGVTDVPEKARLTLEKIRIDVDPLHPARAVLSPENSDGLMQQIRGWLSAFFASQVTLEEALSLVTNTALRDRIVASLNSHLSRHGRVMGAFHARVAFDGDWLPPEFIDDTITVACEVSGRPVEVMSKIQLRRTNAALYQRANIGPLTALRKWLADKLNAIVRTEMFKVEFVELFIKPKFDVRKDRIAAAFGARVQSIGYAVDQIITTPNVRTISGDHFQITIDDTFAVNQLNVSVDLSVEASVATPDAEAIAHLLNRGEDVPAYLRSRILADLRAYCHKTHPVRFYREFERTDETTESTVSEEIEELFRSVLAPLHAEATNLTIKLVRTEVQDRLWDLMRHRGEIGLEIEAFGVAGAIPFAVSYRIVNVRPEGWGRLQGQAITPQVVDAAIKEELEARLATWPPVLLFYQREGERKKVRDGIATHVVDCVREQFGLDAELLSAQRKRTPFEQELSLARLEEHRAGLERTSKRKQLLESAEDESEEAVLEQIRKYDRLILDNQGRFDMEEEVAEWRRRRDELKSKLPSPPPPGSMLLEPMSRVAGLLPPDSREEEE